MKKYIALFSVLFATSAFAVDTPINGTVTAKCSIYTDTEGVYGQPSPYRLSTAAADGGVQPIIRIDVTAADYYYGRITYPTSFSQSPTLDDTVTWTGSVTLGDVSDAGMAGYDTDKTTWDSTHQYDLTVAGTAKFVVSSQADYGFNKSFPAGNYTAIVQSECIAK